MDDQAEQRRLAVIVSLDMAGYSERTRRDEDGATGEVAALAARVGVACAEHGGRVFNTAGDGFMMEFGTVSGALEAAAALAAGPGPPVRLGVHLGEVKRTPSGDLLGHVVNVAARVQAMAPAGGVMVSGDARRALRGQAAAKLVDQGRFKLKRMGESVRLFSLGPIALPARLALTTRRLDAWAALAAVIVLGAATGTWAWLASRGPGDLRVAALPFDGPADDPQTRAFAKALSDEIAATLSKSSILTLSPAQTEALRGPGRLAALKALHAPLALDGSVERDGALLNVRVRLDDARQGTTLWSRSYSGEADHPTALQTAVAAQAADMTNWALDGLRSSRGRLDAASLADFVQGDYFIVYGGAEGRLKGREELLRLTARAPDFSRGHSALAIATGLASWTVEGEPAEALARETRAEAAKAIQLDPHNGEPYLALSYLVGKDDWAGRERLLDQGLKLMPDFAYLHNNRASFLGQVGRSQESLAAIRTGMAAVNDLHPGAHYTYAGRLAETGDYAGASEQLDQLVQMAPAEWTDAARLAFAVLYGPPDRARALLAASAAHPYPGETPAIDAWTAVLQAKADGTAKSADLALDRLLTAIGKRSVNLTEALKGFGVIGKTDSAYGVVDAVYLSRDDGVGLGRDSALMAFYGQSSEDLRRNPRFWPLMQRVGLVDYWRGSGHKPDFCTGPKPLDGCARLSP